MNEIGDIRFDSEIVLEMIVRIRNPQEIINFYIILIQTYAEATTKIRIIVVIYRRVEASPPRTSSMNWFHQSTMSVDFPSIQENNK